MGATGVPTDAASRKAPPACEALSVLARRSAEGDSAAFEALATRLQPPLYGMAFRFLRDSCEAYDLCQEVYLVLFRKLGRYDTTRPFEPWFWRLAVNVGRNYVRRRRPVPMDHLERLVNARAYVPDPMCEALRLAIAELRPQYRTPILLHYYLGRTLREIAITTGGTEPAVRSRLHRARAALGSAMHSISA